ncbi:molybdopterin molybdotransferase MoeA [Dactylosporangium fulvum]|uniref:Molybdopterin molybdenumtransferase n=1 Tax=Dactylosporangium fulvum TaxID=53359 RepID=A0ABY5W8Q9_9ACTN|nr:molybdopterin molybdotransferase MoeA [Dactylosporangium fulvum]UWP85701.1 molybdopterin molybdotransferase MoeA [Dactylosporangium fulvum]
MDWDEARALAHSVAEPLAPSLLDPAAAVGTTLARPLLALIDLPSFDRSAMDGYAVRGAPPWMIRGRVGAGQTAGPPLRPGEAREVATGAPVPEGTDGVLPYEQAIRYEESVTAATIAPAGRHVRRAGEECRRGEQLAPVGTPVTPQLAALAAAVGNDLLEVHPRPLVGMLVTGDELCSSGLPGPGAVRDAIGPMLPGLIAWAGGQPAGLTRLPDSDSALAAALEAGSGQVLLVSGSSSAGPADHLRPCLKRLGAELLVDGVACRPGHPQSLARLPDGTLVIGLPGNPLAALVAFLTLAVPVLAGLRGEALSVPGTAHGPRLPRRAGTTTLVPVRVLAGVAEPVTHAGSAMLRGAAGADAIAVVGPGEGPVRLIALPGGGY